MVVAITATTVASWPPRVTLAVTGLTIGNVVTIARQVAGARTAVRGADTVTVADTSLVAFDAELPFGTPVTYVAVVNNADAATVGPTSYTLTGGKVALSDATTGQAAEVVITAWPDKERARRVSTFAVGGRTVVVSGELGQFAGSINVLTQTDSAREQLATLLGEATSGILQLRQAGGYGGVDCYLVVTSARESRWSQDGTDARRVWTLAVAETDAWAASLPTQSFTFGNFDTAYTGLAFSQFDLDYAGRTFLFFDLVDWTP